MKKRWELLRECADFNVIFNTIFDRYGVKGYGKVLDIIEKELELYEESTDDEWQEVIDNNEVPYSVQWYCGVIDTDYFLNECWL